MPRRTLRNDRRTRGPIGGKCHRAAGLASGACHRRLRRSFEGGLTLNGIADGGGGRQAKAKGLERAAHLRLELSQWRARPFRSVKFSCGSWRQRSVEGALARARRIPEPVLRRRWFRRASGRGSGPDQLVEAEMAAIAGCSAGAAAAERAPDRAQTGVPNRLPSSIVIFRKGVSSCGTDRCASGRRAPGRR